MESFNVERSVFCFQQCCSLVCLFIHLHSNVFLGQQSLLSNAHQELFRQGKHGRRR